MNNEISRSNKIYNSNLTRCTIDEVLNQIKTSDSLRKLVEPIRNSKDPDERGELKKELPYFVTAVFQNDYRNRKNLESSEMMIFDYDHLTDSVSEIKAKLIADPKVFSVFVSPSGEGLKVIYKLSRPITGPKEYSDNYKHFAHEFKIALGKTPDKTSDVSRACFISYDPDIYINYDAKPLKVDDIIAEQQTSLNLKTADLEYVDDAVEYLRSFKLDYDEWTKCGFALASIGEKGRDHFIRLSRNSHYDDSVAVINDKFDNLLETNENQIQLNTLFHLAKEKGFKYEKSSSRIIQPTKPFVDELMEQFKLDDSRDPGKLIGYPLNKFKELAEHSEGIQPGFYLLGAEANVGKTALLTNICLDMLDTNSDVQVVYFSLDDNRFNTIHRLLAVLSQLPINKIRRRIDDKHEKNILEQSRKLILNYIKSEQMILRDLESVQTMDDLRKVLVPSQHDATKRIIFIDGLYNLSVGDEKQGIREQNIQRATTVKQIVDTLRVPLICTGELRKKMNTESKSKAPTTHDIMESGKYSYNAIVIWLMYAAMKAQTGQELQIVIEWAKNKLSDYKDKQALTFNPATSTMKESRFMFDAPVELDFD